MNTNRVLVAIVSVTALVAVASAALVVSGVVTVGVHWPGSAGTAAAGGAGKAATGAIASAGASGTATAASAPVPGAPGSAPGEGVVAAAPVPGSGGAALPSSVTALGAPDYGADVSARILCPPTDSPLCTALLRTASKKLGTSWRLSANQLYVMGKSAIGDVVSKDTGARYVVAWGAEGTPVWTARFGAANANAAGVRAAAPGFSAELLSAMNWTLARPARDAALRSSLSAALADWTRRTMHGAGAPYSVQSIRIARDAQGQVWARAVAQTTASGVTAAKSVEFWARYSGGSWTGKPQPATLPSPTAFFPSVAAKRLFP